VLAAEQRLLGFLVDPSAPPDMVRSRLGPLRTYRFQGLEHQLAFDCFERFRIRPAGDLLASLPDCLVRAGFPEFDLERILGSRPMCPEGALRLCTMLVLNQTQ